MPPSGPGTIYPFTDKTQFDTTYRAICTHKNISLDLSHLVLPPSTTTTTTPGPNSSRQLDLHQLHFSVFKLGGEAKVRVIFFNYRFSQIIDFFLFSF
jgi:hypothetical protein